MEVDRSLWWSVWWPWAVVWLVTVLAVVVAGVVAFVAWRARFRFAPVREVPGLTLYLNAKFVMDLYQVGGFGDALVKEVTHRVGVTKDGKVAFPGLPDLGAGVAYDRQVVKTYLERAEPISAVGVLLDALEAAGSLVHVDLTEQTVVRSAALERAAQEGPVSLRKVKAYVLVKGEFSIEEERDGVTVLLASVGADGAKVRVECLEGGLDDAVPEGVFDAVCLGRVQAWRGDADELLVRPIALFQ
ncbi:hypothetical protein ABZ816_35390 [Actinosynnema sp. NPDC047251]|uniref:Putative membrane protein n=1 Tax=Saccharothrix espanaensis (strain ATCC 51144 / DSM 44229 / JCM 9112 / NBRC 15066 / NRRL 15764) TaxID=1179773 RepID=K0JYG1_SACES|nr:hypothetical protein [Saccharothrix espanaensis]CCH29253.1 putative membrane protein [Saccharothrix espanaensis DSM 44229]